MSDLIIVYKKGTTAHLKSLPERGKGIADALCFRQYDRVEDIIRIFDTDRGELTDVDGFVSDLIKYRDAVNVAAGVFEEATLYRRVVTARGEQ